MGTRVLRATAGIVAFALLTAAALLAQTAAPAGQDPVVAEIRALRADLNQRLEATMRMQLLVARLQLQEQRTSTVVGQLRDVEARLRENEAARQQAAAAFKMFGMDTATDAEKKESPFFALLGGATEKFDATEAELKDQQIQLTRQLADEQARWRTFNAQLDAIEKMFPIPRK
jgi:DNA gyrase/topoisomerase IV subunit A